MTHATAHTALLSTFSTAWSEQTPIAWPNTEFSTPSGPWVRVMADGNVSEQAGFGNGVLQRHKGLFFAQVFAPQDTGTAVADGYAQDVCNALQFKRLDRTGERPVRTYSARLNRVGNDNGWYQINVTIEFEYDEAIP